MTSYNDWTLDTFVFYMAAEINYNAISLIVSILKNKVFITMDHDLEIDQEYEDCIRRIRREHNRYPGFKMCEKYFRRIVQTKVTRLCGRMNIKNKQELFNISFHYKDMKFVAVCSNSNNKRLVSEDSTYSEEVRKYLKEKMGVSVLSINEALE